MVGFFNNVFYGFDFGKYKHFYFYLDWLSYSSLNFGQIIFVGKNSWFKENSPGNTCWRGFKFFLFCLDKFWSLALGFLGNVPNNLQGLVQCYINGLPFWKMQLTGTMLFVTTGFVVTEILISLYPVCKKTFSEKKYVLEVSTHFP